MQRLQQVVLAVAVTTFLIILLEVQMEQTVQAFVVQAEKGGLPYLPIPLVIPLVMPLTVLLVATGAAVVPGQPLILEIIFILLVEVVVILAVALVARITITVVAVVVPLMQEQIKSTQQLFNLEMV